MGVMQQKRPTKSRPAQPPAVPARRGPTTPEPQTDSAAMSAHTDTRVAMGGIVRKSAKDDQHVPATTVVSTARSPVGSRIQGPNTVTIAADRKDKNTDGEERVSLPPSDKGAHKDAKDRVSPADDVLGLQLSNLTLDDNDLTQQLKGLNIKEKEEDEERTEDLGLVSRGPDRIVRGIRSELPYVLEQHILSSDNQGGATVLYPSIPQQNNFANSQNVPPQENITSYWQSFRRETGDLTYNNCQNVCQDIAQRTSHNELDNIFCNTSLPDICELTEDDFKFLEPWACKMLECPEMCQTNIMQQSETGTQYLSQTILNEKSSDSSSFDNIDEIIESNKYDQSIQYIKQELYKEALDKQLPPTPPDSAYDSDEGTIGSPASTVSGGLQSETEKVQPVSSPFPAVTTKQNNIIQQTGFPVSSVSQFIQTVPPGMVLVLQQKPQTVMSPPMTTQSLISPTTPPISAFVPRPILPGVSIPPPCNEPALKRIASVMTEQVKDNAWAIIFAKPDSDFTKEDEDGNMLLGNMLSHRQNYKNFMEVFHVLIQRLKRIIGRNQDMARKLLATPNRCGYTPLDLACRYFLSSEQDALVVRYLADTMVEEGLEIGKELDSNGNTLLHKICDYGDKAQFIMAELLSIKDQGGNNVFDVNKGNNERKTPLHVAALNHSEQTPCIVLAQLLMRSGALASEQEGCSGNTVFHCVAKVSCDPNLLVTLLAKTKAVEKVVNKANFNGDTPLHMVAANPTITLERQRLAVQHLIHYEAQPRLPNKSGKVPLSLVAADRKQDIKTVLYHR